MLLLSATTVYGMEIETTMNTSRPVKAGADECYRTVTNINNGANVKLLGRNSTGSWVFIWADAGDGWVPTSSVNANGNVFELGIWTDHFDGEQCATPPPAQDLRICGQPGNTTAANTTRWTDIFETADPDTETGRAYPPATALTINGRDFWGCWVNVSGAGDGGWIPVNALDAVTIMDLPVMVDNSGGCVIHDDNTITCPNP
ncbi:MAG TPA: hypothetical protein ENJ56_03355 [Anaerolineae bacterium]|nr:hypothetical protein [Anaerolineae bacterium]